MHTYFRETSEAIIQTKKYIFLDMWLMDNSIIDHGILKKRRLLRIDNVFNEDPMCQTPTWKQAIQRFSFGNLTQGISRNDQTQEGSFNISTFTQEDSTPFLLNLKLQMK